MTSRVCNETWWKVYRAEVRMEPVHVQRETDVSVYVLENGKVHRRFKQGRYYEIVPSKEEAVRATRRRLRAKVEWTARAHGRARDALTRFEREYVHESGKVNRQEAGPGLERLRPGTPVDGGPSQGAPAPRPGAIQAGEARE